MVRPGRLGVRFLDEEDMNAVELGAFSYSMLMVMFGLLFRVGVLRMVLLVRCVSGARVLVVCWRRETPP
jgi:hypothetical protein